MNKRAFDIVLKEIVGEHETAQLEEQRQVVRTEKRRRIFGHVRFTFIWLLLGTLFTFAFNYREQISKMWDSKPATSAEGKANATLAGARETAATRDAIVGEITK